MLDWLDKRKPGTPPLQDLKNHKKVKDFLLDLGGKGVITQNKKGEKSTTKAKSPPLETAGDRGTLVYSTT